MARLAKSYDLNHKTIPESTRSMLHNLETIKKVFVEKNNKKAKASVAKAGTAPQKRASVPCKKGKGGGSGGPAPKKACTAKYCKWCKAVDGPYQTHNTRLGLILGGSLWDKCLSC